LPVKQVSPPIPKGYSQCLQILLDAGFDPKASTNEGVTLIMNACKYGRLEIVNLLMDKGLDFSQTDAQGQNPLHYACSCKSPDVLSAIFNHSKASQCGVSSTMLAVKDNAGQTPLHIAARENVAITIGFLARHGIDMAMSTRDREGMTPLLVACAFGSLDSIRNLVSLGSAVRAVDDAQRGCLWHLFHRQFLPGSVKMRPVTSESDSYRTSKSRSLADDQCLTRDIDIIKLLISEGCQFYSAIDVSLADLCKREPYDVENFELSGLNLEAADVAANELSFTLFKLLPKHLSPKECWKTGYYKFFIFL